VVNRQVIAAGSPRVLFAAGQTAGHVHPALAIAARLTEGVSQAMHDTLTHEARLTGAVVFYDRPAARFAPALRELPAPAVLRNDLGGNGNGHRSLVALAPSSWTLDEDVDLLLDAVSRYDARADVPPLLVVMSGDGPSRRAYAERVSHLHLRRTRVRLVWVPYEEYPSLLAHADVGVSLHRSASGVDLPMKVADMQGSGLPVLALGYDCLHEEIEADDGVRFFSTASELAVGLVEFSKHGARPHRPGPPRVTWEDEWRETCLPLVLRHV
jgi:beta-1,4-mannosyltransferase